MSMEKLFVCEADLISLYHSGGISAIRTYIKKYDAYITTGNRIDKILEAVLENKSDIYIKECLLDNKKKN